MMQENKDKSICIICDATYTDSTGLTVEEIRQYYDLNLIPQRTDKVCLEIAKCSFSHTQDPNYTLVYCEGEKFLVKISFDVLMQAKKTNSIVIKL